MMSSIIDLLCLTRFKEMLLELVDEKLAGKQDAGEYLTAEDVANLARFDIAGEVRDRDLTKPTYGISLEGLPEIVENAMGFECVGDVRDRDASKPSYGLI